MRKTKFFYSLELIFISKIVEELSKWFMPIIPALWKQKQEDGEFEESLGHIVNPVLKKKKIIWAPVGHDCYPSYSGSRDQKNHNLKPAHANSLKDPILKTTITNKGW
jgi:hypothetical protein